MQNRMDFDLSLDFTGIICYNYNVTQQATKQDQKKGWLRWLRLRRKLKK